MRFRPRQNQHSEDVNDGDSSKLLRFISKKHLQMGAILPKKEICCAAMMQRLRGNNGGVNSV
jgi:hypothetical protein